MKEEIIKLCNNSKDILNRTIKKNNIVIDIIFCESLTDTSLIEKYILKPINNNQGQIEDIITSSNINIIKSVEEASNILFEGSTLIIINNTKIYSIETKANLDRSISESEIEGSIYGPKDGFNEHFNTNVGLIRKRIRNKNLTLDTLTLGSESKTKIGICYMNDLVDKDLLNKTKEKIKILIMT